MPETRPRSAPDLSELPIQLDEGLVIRGATGDDADRLGDFATRMFGPVASPNDVRVWAWDLVGGRHPTVQPNDVLVVEEPESGELVSTVSLVPQIWSYGGVPFEVGQIETVATHPTWRRHGLIRRQIEVLHAACDRRRIPVRVIIGNPFFYHQFGYDYALPHHQGRGVDLHQLERDGRDSEPAFRLRPASSEDLPLCERLDRQAAARLLVSCPRGQRRWEYELNGHHEESLNRYGVYAIEAKGGDPVGVLVATFRKASPYLTVVFLEVEHVPWIDCVPAVLADLHRLDPDRPLLLLLGPEHPAYQASPRLLAREWPGVAWYVQVPDIPRFLVHVAATLEANLAASPAAGVSTELRISFYNDGLTIRLERGRLVAVEGWTGAPSETPGASMPRVAFLQLMFAYRSLEELEADSPDCRCRTDRVRAVLDGLFRKRPSNIWQQL